MDPDAARIANLLVGNAPGAALLEITLLGPRLISETGTWLALTGADLTATLDGAPLPTRRPLWAPAGARIGFGGPRRGCRAYPAVDGGLDVPQVLGSRSTDSRAALGGPAGRLLQAGDRLPLGTAHLPPPQRFDRPAWPRWWVTHMADIPINHPARLRFIPATDWTALPEHERQELAGNRYRISSQCDRMGLRLSGPALSLPDGPERLSAGVTFGTIQLPPDGQPIILGPERQTTGGYPVLGTVARCNWPRLDTCALAMPWASHRSQWMPPTPAARPGTGHCPAGDGAEPALAVEHPHLHGVRRPFAERHHARPHETWHDAHCPYPGSGRPCR